MVPRADGEVSRGRFGAQTAGGAVGVEMLPDGAQHVGVTFRVKLGYFQSDAPCATTPRTAGTVSLGRFGCAGLTAAEERGLQEEWFSGLVPLAWGSALTLQRAGSLNPVRRPRSRWVPGTSG
jgi:hypothetical protein